jgi:hypothetical protein
MEVLVAPLLVGFYGLGIICEVVWLLFIAPKKVGKE